MSPRTTNNLLNNHPATMLPGFKRRLQSRQHIIESFEAKENKDRNAFDKFADIMTARLGSVIFLTLNALFFLLWVLVNNNYIATIKLFDPFPFSLLTTIVSLEAIFLSIIVLISQNRASRIDDLRDEINLQITTIAEEEITKMMELQVLILKKQGIDVSKDKELQQMLEPTNTAHIETELEKQFR